MTPAKFRTRSIEITAIQWTGKNASEVFEFCGEHKVTFNGTDGSYLIVVGAFGPARAEEGYWIVKGTHGDLTPCSPEEFAEKYESTEAPEERKALTQKTNGELILDPAAPAPEGEYLACTCSDPPEQDGDPVVECGKEAVAVWNIAYMGTIIAMDLHACARHDQGIKQMTKVPPVGMRRALKRVELADAIPDGHTGGVVMKKR